VPGETRIGRLIPSPERFEVSSPAFLFFD